jgi:hypothetical protein
MNTDDDNTHYVVANSYKYMDLIMAQIEVLITRLHEAEDWQTISEISKIKNHLDELFKVYKI